MTSVCPASNGEQAIARVDRQYRRCLKQLQLAVECSEAYGKRSATRRYELRREEPEQIVVNYICYGHFVGGAVLELT